MLYLVEGSLPSARSTDLADADVPLRHPRPAPKHKDHTDRHTELFRRSFLLCLAVAEAGFHHGTENPEDPGVDPDPSIYNTEEATVVRRKSQAVDVRFDQCM